MEKSNITYNEFIENILNSRGRFNLDKTIYTERHHIIPRCKNGTNDDSNLIDLLPDEHFIAHYLLAKENPHDKSLVWAVHCMVSLGLDKIDVNKHSKEYAEARLIARKFISESQLGNTTTKNRKWYSNGIENKMFYEGEQPDGWVNKRLPFSEKAKQNMSKARIGNTATKGYHWYNNGIINVVSKECPKGFSKGQLKHTLKVK